MAEKGGGSNPGSGHGSHSHVHSHSHGHPRDAEEKQFKQALFIGLVIILAILAFAVFQNMAAIMQNIVWVLLGLLIIFVLARYDYILQLKDFERAVIFRFGRVNRVGGPGWAIVLPPAESYTFVDLRTQTIDIPKQEVVTKDGIEVEVDAAIYIKVNKDNQSVINSVIEVEDYKNASEIFVVGLIRDKAGSMELTELISKVEELNTELRKELERLSIKWGVVVEEAVIQDIEIPKSVLDSMHAKSVAIQNKLARIERAEGHRAEIELVRSAAEKLNDRALSYYYLKALGKLGEGKSTKFFFPMELSNLAKSISGSQGLQQSDIEDMFRKYAPLVKSLADKGAAKKKQKK